MSKISRKKTAPTSNKATAATGATKSPVKSARPAKATPSTVTSAVRTPALVEGAPAPAFALPRDGGGIVSLADFAGRKLVLFFYPRADTPGCTREAIDFTRLKPDFDKAGTAVIGMSADPVKAQIAFRDKHALAVPLLSDETQAVLNVYGVWREKSMYGKTFMGIVRTTVLIGTDGKIAKIWRNVRVDDHAAEVLAAARAL